MQINNKKKICIVASSLAKGGAEKSAANLSILLSDIGFDVYVVIVLADVDYKYSGRLLNLGQIKAQNNTIFGRLDRLRTFKLYLDKNNFDYVIDSRSRNSVLREFILNSFVYDLPRTVYIVHSYNLNNYFISPNRLAKAIYGKAKCLVCVSDAIKTKVIENYDFNNVKTIYNAIEISGYSAINQSSTENYVLFFGRLNDKIKNVSMLIDAYSVSILPEHNIKLKIVGDGQDKQMLQQKVETLQLTDRVQFLPYQKNLDELISNAKFSLLTSRYEGFPMALLESLSLGVPVVSVDCKSGPSEIINHESNGLLVKNNETRAFAKAMDRLIEDEQLYLRCKQNAVASVAKFSMQSIAKEWQKLLQ